ncbi:MAG: hypothetical protein ACFCUT_01405 [Kiloniellaceae bacterium]
MPILIPDIFSDPMAYLQAEALLRRLFDRIKCEEYRGPLWTQWMTNTGNNGTRLYDDGMPVYTQICEARSKGIVIWLANPKEIEAISNEPETFFEAETPVRDPELAKIACLDITCVLSDENLVTAEDLIRLYMVDDVTPEALMAVIQETGLGFHNRNAAG